VTLFVHESCSSVTPRQLVMFDLSAEVDPAVATRVCASVRHITRLIDGYYIDACGILTTWFCDSRQKGCTVVLAGPCNGRVYIIRKPDTFLTALYISCVYINSSYWATDASKTSSQLTAAYGHDEQQQERRGRAAGPLQGRVW
jgi:hypothetical protein